MEKKYLRRRMLNISIQIWIIIVIIVGNFSFFVQIDCEMMLFVLIRLVDADEK